MTESSEGTIIYGSENVFADLGLPNPEERFTKAKLASTINEMIRARGLTQKKAGMLMGIDQPKVSKISRGRLSEFSTEWLLARLLHMGLDIDIVVHTKSSLQKREGSISVVCV